MNPYTGTTDRGALLAKATRLADRLAIPRSAVKVRALTGSAVGITLAAAIGEVEVRWSCESRPGNAVAIVLWMQCRAPHFERGIDRDLMRVMSAYLLPGGA